MTRRAWGCDCWTAETPDSEWRQTIQPPIAGWACGKCYTHPMGPALICGSGAGAWKRRPLESGATVMLVKADEGALRSGRLDAAGYISVLRELAERLPGVKLASSTVSIDKPDDLLEMFNRRVREYALQTDGVLLDTADIESWHGGEQALQDESPVRHAAYRDDSGLPNAENLKHQGAAMWWLLVRLTGWEGSAVSSPQGEDHQQ